MVLLLGEAFLALFIIVFIMWWTLKDADNNVANTDKALKKDNKNNYKDVDIKPNQLPK